MVRELDPGSFSGDLGEASAAALSPLRAHPAQVAVVWVTGAAATVAAVVLGSVLALVFAATLAFVLVLAAGFLALLAVAWRLRRPRPVSGPVIEARKVGHSWVAYGWDQPS
jgi:predicted MFS family arabinose efflux permease